MCSDLLANISSRIYNINEEVKIFRAMVMNGYRLIIIVYLIIKKLPFESLQKTIIEEFKVFFDIVFYCYMLYIEFSQSIRLLE